MLLAKCELSSFIHFGDIHTLQLLRVIAIDWVSNKYLAIQNPMLFQLLAVEQWHLLHRDIEFTLSHIASV